MLNVAVRYEVAWFQACRNETELLTSVCSVIKHLGKILAPEAKVGLKLKIPLQIGCSFELRNSERALDKKITKIKQRAYCTKAYSSN
jgi:hypothetical protein